jgi:YbbR domain-containing protein
MTDFTSAAITNAYSNDQIKQMKYDLTIANKNIETLQDTTNALRRQLMEKDNQIDNAKCAILEAFDNESFDRENMEVIAEALDISLTKEVNVTINVTFSGTVDVPIGFDIEGNLENYVDFEATASGWGNVDIECDLFTDGVDITVNS